MRQMSRKQYVLEQGTRCPFCKSERITNDGIESDGRFGWHMRSCDACHKHWEESWQMVGYHKTHDDRDPAEEAASKRLGN